MTENIPGTHNEICLACLNKSLGGGGMNCALAPDGGILVRLWGKPDPKDTTQLVGKVYCYKGRCLASDDSYKNQRLGISPQEERYLDNILWNIAVKLCSRCPYSMEHSLVEQEL